MAQNTMQAMKRQQHTSQATAVLVTGFWCLLNIDICTFFSALPVGT
jgi:hypothetical protein